MPFNLSESLVDTLLDKLSTDNDFRNAFQKSPRQALASIGHAPAAAASDSDQGAWSCMQCTKLASPEAIKASREVLRQQFLSAKSVYKPINLQV